jgi:transposase
MAKKGQTFKHYSFELKKAAVEMRLKGMTKKQVAEKLGIHDIDRLKVWKRRFKEVGDYGLLDHRGRREEYVDRDRYVKRLELENDVLKKWLGILKREGKRLRSSRRRASHNIHNSGHLYSVRRLS